jgi:hypothetical protein
MPPLGSRLLKELANSDGFVDEGVTSDMPRASRLQAAGIDYREFDAPPPPRRKPRATATEEIAPEDEEVASEDEEAASEDVKSLWDTVREMGRKIDHLIVGG